MYCKMRREYCIKLEELLSAGVAGMTEENDGRRQSGKIRTLWFPNRL